MNPLPMNCPLTPSLSPNGGEGGCKPGEGAVHGPNEGPNFGGRGYPRCELFRPGGDFDQAVEVAV